MSSLGKVTELCTGVRSAYLDPSFVIPSTQSLSEGVTRSFVVINIVLRMLVIYLLFLNPFFTIPPSPTPSLSPKDISSERLQMLSQRDIKRNGG
ncbi:uncharacterized protein [Medicago truncatula]|uniref:uncharacterized protein isoform X1 n=1 Tax=Medicago truncatula TaxID=3880 RepID=UPI000D2F2F67|nr:uncharacterized protein LOC25494568 isoform X1 [Medicago truncatula]